MLRAGLVMVVVTIAGAACSTANTAGTPAAAKAALATPHPLSVQVATDATKVTSAIIGPSGGQVSATSASGASMTLDVPAGALLSSHTVALTPLASLTGFPLKGGMLAGAQLGPDGLLLAKPARLTIKLPAAPSGSMKLYGFGYRHDGRELHLMPAKGSAGAVSLSLWHFSGAGVGSGSSSDANAQGANAPTAPEDQFEQAQALGQQVIPILLGWDSELTGEIGQSPNLPVLDTIYQQTLVFDAMATQAGRPDLAHDIFTKIATVLKVAAALALTDCTSRPDAVQGLRVIRWLEWANGHPEVVKELDAATLEAEVVKCLRFRLDFMTKVHFAFGPEAIDLAVEAKGVPVNAVTAVPLRFAPGTGDLKYDSYVWTVPGVQYTMDLTVDRPFAVEDISMNLDDVDSPDASAVVDGMTVTVDFGDTSETAHVIAPFPVPPLPFKSFYADAMMNMHHGAGVGPHLFAIGGWLAGAEPQFASLHETCPCEQPPAAGGLISETQDTTWVLRHTPS